MKRLFVAILLLASGPAVFAHSGGKDRNGCHTDRKTGEYHCHSGSAASPRELLEVASRAVPLGEVSAIRLSAQDKEGGGAAETEASTRRRAPQETEAPIDRLDFMRPAKEAPDGFAVVRPSVSQIVELAQILLRAQSYEITDPSGELGYSTILAIRQFQTRHNLNADGRLSPALLLELAKAPSTCPQARP